MTAKFDLFRILYNIASDIASEFVTQQGLLKSVSSEMVFPEITTLLPERARPFGIVSTGGALYDGDGSYISVRANIDTYVVGHVHRKHGVATDISESPIYIANEIAGWLLDYKYHDPNVDGIPESVQLMPYQQYVASGAPREFLAVVPVRASMRFVYQR